MKYVWMLILGVAWIWWTVRVIKVVIFCYKHYGNPFEYVDDPTMAWLVLHGALVFVISFVRWLFDT